MSHQNMQIHITGRHVSVTESIKEYARKKLEGIGLDFPRVIDAHVILDIEKHRHRCEIVLSCANHIHIEAHDECDDMYASIDLAMAKLLRQMRKYKTKLQRHHRGRKQQTFHVEEHVFSVEGLNEHEEAQPKKLQSEKFVVKPMFVDEAVLQLELSPRQFLVFLNSETEKINIVYRRKTDNFGLIELSVKQS